MLNIKNFYMLLLSNFSISEKNKQKDFHLQSNYLLSFKDYLIKLSPRDFVKNKPEEIQELLLYIYFLRNMIPQQLMKNFLENKNYVLYKESQTDKDTNINDNNKIIDDLDKFLISNVNYEGYEDFVTIINNTLKDNEFISYKICVLQDSHHKPQNYQAMTMDELIKDYCIFKFHANDKKLLSTCPMCGKKEISLILKSLSVGEKKLTYLKTYGRYVILERLESEEFKDKLEDSTLKSIYIKYGFSLYYKYENKEKFKEAILKFIHDIFCS